MGVLGKDLFDIGRPIDHVKVRFGDQQYWIEHCELPQTYGTILTELLNYDASEYCQAIDRLLLEKGKRDSRETLKVFEEVIRKFAHLPYYRLYVEDYDTLELGIIGGLINDANAPALADKIIADDGHILNRYVWARDDILFIQRRYTWFLDELAKGQTPEKKKGQRKHSLAEQIVERTLEPYVSGRSLGEDRAIDAPRVNVQYMIYEPTNSKPEAVEQVYFDRLVDFVYVEFMKGIQKGFIPKRCGNCGRWFLQEPGATYAYCDRIAPGESEKTCRDVGAAVSFQAKVRNNDIWKLHQRAYKKYHARVRKGTMTKGEFEIWARGAEELRNQALEKYECAETSERAAIIEELRRELNAR